MSKLVSKLTVKTAADHPQRKRFCICIFACLASWHGVWPKLIRHDEKSRPSSRARGRALARSRWVGELARGGASEFSVC